jgi:thiosulfate/3-mercaptopyruvate sulfurtransferase
MSSSLLLPLLLLVLPSGRDAQKEFAAARIPGAQFWDIDGVCNPSTDLPHMLPSEAAFAAAADALGISNDDAVVVYDGMGMFAAPRAWWTWRVFGHSR